MQAFSLPDARTWLPQAVDRAAFGIVALGLFVLYGPTLWDASQGRWAGETQGHELLILAISAWMLFRRRAQLAALVSAPSVVGGSALLLLGLLLYVFGRTQDVLRIELLSLIVVVSALLLHFKGRPALRLAWFPLFFMLFALPLPFMLALALTAPM